MGTYKVKDGFIEVRWSVSKSERWKIKSIDEDSMLININLPVTRPVYKRFLRLRDEEIITGP